MELLASMLPDNRMLSPEINLNIQSFFYDGFENGLQKIENLCPTWLIHDDPFLSIKEEMRERQLLVIKIFHHTTFGK